MMKIKKRARLPKFPFPSMEKGYGAGATYHVDNTNFHGNPGVIVVEVVDNMDMETVRMLRIVVVVVVADYCSQMIGLGLDYSLMKNVQLEQLLKLLVYLYLSLVEQLKLRITIYNQL